MAAKSATSVASARQTTTNNSADTTLGGRITHAREARGLTISQLSRLLGVLPKTVSNWETDRSEPRFNLLHRLAGVLHVPPMWLIGGGEGIDFEEEQTNTVETAGLARQLDQLTDRHARMATMLFEAQAELRRLQSQIETLRAGD